jgi:hypothetical protein
MLAHRQRSLQTQARPPPRSDAPPRRATFSSRAIVQEPTKAPPSSRTRLPAASEETHSPPSSSESSSDDQATSMLRSQALRRPVPSRHHPSRRRSSATQRPASSPYLHDSDSDDDDAPAFLPFSTAPTEAGVSPTDSHPSADTARRPLPQPTTRSAPREGFATQPPRHPATAARLAHLRSPSHKNREGSDGTTTGKSSSMGSSFSDLDGISSCPFLSLVFQASRVADSDQTQV